MTHLIEVDEKGRIHIDIRLAKDRKTIVHLLKTKAYSIGQKFSFPFLRRMRYLKLSNNALLLISDIREQLLFDILENTELTDYSNELLLVKNLQTQGFEITEHQAINPIGLVMFDLVSNSD